MCPTTRQKRVNRRKEKYRFFLFVLFCFVAFFFLYITVQLLDIWRRVWGWSCTRATGSSQRSSLGISSCRIGDPLFSNLCPGGASLVKVSFTGGRQGAVGSGWRDGLGGTRWWPEGSREARCRWP